MTRFAEHISSLVGKSVKLGRGGPDQVSGTLVSVKGDYLTIYSDDGSLVHYPLHHLKSVSEVMSSGENSGSVPTGLPGSLPDSFWDLMTSCRGYKIQVYDHGPESATGFVFDVGEDYVKLVTSPDEIVHYPFFHIRSCRMAKAKGKDENDKDGGGKNRSKNKRGGSGKSGRSGRSGRSGGGGRSGRGGRSGKGGRSGGGGRSGKSGRSGRSGRSGKGARSGKSTRSSTTGRSMGSARRDPWWRRGNDQPGAD